MKYYRVKTKSGRTFWATDMKVKSSGAISFIEVDKYGNHVHGSLTKQEIRIFSGLPEDYKYIKHAVMSLHYGWLEIDNSHDELAKEINKSFGKFEG